MPLRSATARDLQLVDAAQKGDHNLVVGLLHLGASPWADVPKGFSALHAAAKQGSLQAVQALLQRGAFVNALTDDGSTALNLAAHHGHVDVMGVLLAAHADVPKADNSGRTPLHGATSCGHTDMMQLMLDAGAAIDAADSRGLTPLHLACTSGKQQAAQLLVSRGASLEATCSRGLTPLHYASQHGHLEVVQLLVDANASLTAVMKVFKRTPLHLAAAAGHHQVVSLLINSGAQLDVKDSRGLMALHAAVQNNYTQAVQCLLAADSTPAHVDAQGSEGTPLHVACLKGCKEVVPLLIKAGADVNARSPAQRTPLHQAAISGHSEIVEQLLAAGADSGALTRTGANGLHVAAMRGFPTIIKQLLAALGAELGSAAIEAFYDGKTPLQHAVENRQTTCVEVLLAAGADPSKLYGAAAVGSEDGRSLAGASVLHRAAQVKHAAAVPLLAKPSNIRRLWKGQTALHLALTNRWSWQHTDTSAAQALLTAGSPVGVANADGITALALAAGSSDAAARALLPAMVRRECERYKQLQQGKVGPKRQLQQQDEEEGVEEQEPAAVLAAVFAAVSALLEATAAAGVAAASGAEGAAAGVNAAAGEGSSHEPLLGCFKAVLEVLGEAAAGDLLQQLLSKAPGPSETAAAAGSRTLLLYQVFVKAWLAELQPLMQQRWGMTNRLAALVTDPLQQHPQPRRLPEKPAPYKECWALSQSALLAAQASAAAAAGHWEWLVLCLEQLMGLHKPSAEVVLLLLEQEQQHEGARDLSGMCMALLGAWTAAQQQVAVKKQRELAEAVVLAVQAAQQQHMVTGRGRRRRQLV